MNLKRNVLYTSFGYGAYSACNFIMGVLINHLGSKNALGIYGTASNLCNPFMVLAALNLRGLYVANVFTEFKIENYAATRIINFVFALVAVFFWAYYKLDGSVSLAFFTIVFMLGNVFDQTADMYFGIYQVRDRVDLLALSQTIRGLLSIGLFVLFFLASHRSLVWGIAGSSLASLLMLIGFDFPIASWVETHHWFEFIWPKVNLKDYWTIAKTALPLTFSVFLDAFALSYPIVVMAHDYGPKTNTPIITYGYIVALGQIFVTGITVAIAPRLGSAMKKNERTDFLHVVISAGWMMAGLGVMMLVLTYFAGPDLVNGIFRKTFIVDEALFLWIVLGGVFRFGTSLLGTAITSLKWVKGQFFWSLPRLLIALIISGPLVKDLGLYGVAYAILIPTLVKFLIGVGIFLWLQRSWGQRKLPLDLL